MTSPRREEPEVEVGQSVTPQAGKGSPEVVTCSTCKDTGYLSRRFYAVARTCDCAVGLERAGWASLTAEEQNARAAAEAEAHRMARRARRGRTDV